MDFVLQPWQLCVVVLAGWINRQQQEVIDYLRTENLLAGLLRRRVELQRCLKLDQAQGSRGVLQAALEDAVAMILVDISGAIG